jgi:hypothetical protein
MAWPTNANAPCGLSSHSPLALPGTVENAHAAIVMSSTCMHATWPFSIRASREFGTKLDPCTEVTSTGVQVVTGCASDARVALAAARVRASIARPRFHGESS